MAPSTTSLKFTTHSHLRHRLLLSTLTGQPLHISQIRANSLTPGLTPAEFSLLRLLDSLTNGTLIEISVTGTSFLYKPGLITGNNGKPLTHTLPENCNRGVTYYLEVLAILAPFSKAAFSVTFNGGVVTSATEAGDASVDTFRSVFLPDVTTRFDIIRNIDVRVLKRSAAIPGAGEVTFTHAHQIRLPKTLHLTVPGRIKRIRGVSYCVGVTAGNNARMIEAARGVLNRFLPDVYVYSDVGRAQVVGAGYGLEGKKAEKATGTKKVGVGFGISLSAETGTGCVVGVDAVAGVQEAAEDVGKRAAWMLLEEVERGGCVGRVGVLGVLTMMMMGVEGDVGRVVVGKEVISEGVIEGLRDMKKFFNTEVGIRESGDGLVQFSVVGRGVGNVGRKLA